MLIGSEVCFGDGSTGTIIGIRPNRPWFVDIANAAGAARSVSTADAMIEGESFAHWLTRYGFPHDRDGWSMLVQACSPTHDTPPPPTTTSAQSPAGLQDALRYGVGLIKWSGGHNNQTGRENEYGFIEAADGDLYFHRSNVVSPWDKLRTEVRVLYRHIKGRSGKMAAGEVRILDDLPDDDLLTCVQAPDDSGGAHLDQRLLALFIACEDESLRAEALTRLARAGSTETLARLADYLTAPLTSGTKATLLNALDTQTLLRPEATALRSMLPRHKHLETLIALDDLTGREPEVLAAIQKPDADPSGTTAVLATFWRRFPPQSPHDPLFPYAPAGIRNRIIEGLSDVELLACFHTDREFTCAFDGADPEHGLFGLFLSSEDALRGEAAKRLLRFASQQTLCRMADHISQNLVPSALADLLDALESKALLRPEAIAVRSILPRHKHLEALIELEALTDYEAEALATLKKPEASQSREKAALAVFWNKFPPLGTKDPMLPFAPEHVKIAVYKAHYADFLHGLETLFDSLDDVTTRLGAKEAYRALDPLDNRLTGIWAGKAPSEGVLTRMLSARAAEKAVMTLYRAQGCKTDDVAIGQLHSGSTDWRTHDVRIDDAIAVDVKNSRRPFYGKHFYVEHTVPKFKLDRKGRNVRIAGILSPYVRLDAIRDPENIASDCEDLVYLGETDADDFDKLVTAFQTLAFQLERGPGRTIPNWVFDYPAGWYTAFSARRDALINTCARPHDDEWQYVLPNRDLRKALPALHVLGIDLPDTVFSGLEDWQRALSSKLVRNVKVLPRLPAIYVTILMDFVEKLGNAPIGFSPTDYKPLLFPSGEGQKSAFPLGTIDPLGIVEKLIDALQTVWLQRDKLKLANLVTFRFSGLGILQGKALRSDHWITLLAYCGGTVYQKDEQGNLKFDGRGQPYFQSRCGNSPLIKGKHENCSVCGRLVCNKCKFCSEECEAVRLKKLFEEAKRPSSHPPAWDLIPLEAYANGY